ncbi:hypothetical protein [uncultured Shewanella sp.]|uniref:hypothetical protein n=1 Tax=uncultured Shewanella sp. TaxID=173975 RepID=UPI002626C28C|nr:hypothetical protein [uncultured Shewanella sp.]
MSECHSAQSALDLSRRRQLIQQHAVINGIDYILVKNETCLELYFIKPVFNAAGEAFAKTLPRLNTSNIILELLHAGVKQSLTFDIEFIEEAFYLQLTLDEPLPNQSEAVIKITLLSDAIDPFFSSAQVKSHYTPQSALPLSAADVSAVPRLDYRAKDYDTFKQLIETELTHNIPDWRDRNAADMMVMVTEVLAYTGDMLSYKQDAVATEAYLSTARFDLSLQRHCRLLDYTIDKNTTARAWVTVKVDTAVILPPRTLFFCGGDEQSPVLSLFEYQDRQGGKEVVFEAMHEADCRPEYNHLIPYDFGIQDYVIPKGCQTLAVKGKINIKKGQLVALMDKQLQSSPQVVRLIQDGVYQVDPLSEQVYTQLNWYAHDALRQSWLANSSCLCANVILVDRGETLPFEKLMLYLRNGQYFAQLKHTHLVHGNRLDVFQFNNEAASEGIKQVSATATPQLQVVESLVPLDIGSLSNEALKGQYWTNVTDFLDSTPNSQHVVLDEHQGMAELRFGDGLFGAFPNKFNHFYASCRITPNKDHQIAAGKINQLYLPEHLNIVTEAVTEVKNLHPVGDLQAKKSAQAIKLAAPVQHRQRLNLALAQDYIDLILTDERVENVYFEKKWSGSHAVFYFYLYPRNEANLDEVIPFLMQQFALYQVLNQRVVIKHFTPLLLKMSVNIAVKAGYSMPALYQGLRLHFSDDAQEGILAPERFSFGTPLYASEILETTLNIKGVETVQLCDFQTLPHYIGSNNQAFVETVIVPKSHQVISFACQGRQSDVSFTLTKGESDEQF